jgi:hypothetical protein
MKDEGFTKKKKVLIKISILLFKLRKWEMMERDLFVFQQN